MRALGLASGILLLPLIKPAQAANCTQEQIDTIEKIFPLVSLKCFFQVETFQVCDENCLASFKERVPQAPDCVADGYTESMLDYAKEDYEKCQNVSGLTAGKYMPLASKITLTECTSEQKDTWYSKYGVNSSYANCWSRATPETGCSNECLAAIEEGVLAAPICADASGYWYGEVKKEHLVRCLTVRKDSLKDNAVLNTPVSQVAAKIMETKNETNGGNVSTPTPSATSPAMTTIVGYVGAAVVSALALALL